MIGLFKFWVGQLQGKRGDDRPFIRQTTDGSRKWNDAHCAACVFCAPDNVCICNEFHPVVQEVTRKKPDVWPPWANDPDCIPMAGVECRMGIPRVCRTPSEETCHHYGCDMKGGEWIEEGTIYMTPYRSSDSLVIDVQGT